ncbi:helix-turn-helix domain-containing protein [Paenibacillus sinopodophylli]|uniref:helix-turn-helix domain-containing protein n=1 Tax=Paenibacillus sinopodophylli TaxID=1837342 RepID=UPI00110CC14F|nr:helix-turn-helix domain-containing protein [Paenibacillus sinopodophylli]
MLDKRLNLLSIHEAMDMLGVSRSTFDRWRKQKHLPYTKLGKEVLVDPIELESWIKHHSTGIPQRAAAMESKIAAGEQHSGTITIGYQSSYAHVWTAAIMKELGWFEEEIFRVNPERAKDVRWVDAANGPELVKGMIGGHVQIASMGDYPIALSSSLARLLPSFQSILIAFDGKSRRGSGISLVVRKGIHIREVSDISKLKMRTVAQSSSGYRLTKLLIAAGGNPNHILHQDMDVTMAGIVQRNVECSMLVEPYLSLVQYHGTGQVLFQEELGEDYLTGVIAEESWARGNREIVVAYLKAHLRVHQFLRKEPAEAAKIMAKMKGIPADLTARVMKKVRWDAALYKKDIHTLTLLKQENMRLEGGLFVHHADIRYDAEFLDEAIEALHLPLPNAALLTGDWESEQVY